MILVVHVHTRSQMSRVRAWQEDTLHIDLCATPKENEANIELLRFLSSRLKLPKTSLSIARGHKSRIKQIAIPGASFTEIRKLLQPG